MDPKTTHIMLEGGMLMIANQGQRIASTNYWDSPQAQHGLCFLSWNAGAARLLLPDPLKAALREMKSARCVIVSRGPWTDFGGQDALELLFEDDSPSPFSIVIGVAQTDRLLPEDNQGGGLVLTVWTRGGEKLRLPAKYRVVPALPCLDAWHDH